MTSRGEPVLVLVTGLPGTGKSTVAGHVGDRLGAPVFGWDWFMGALTPFAGVQEALRADVATHRAVGWSLLEQAARSQLRRGFSIVLDGVARDDQVAGVRRLGHEEGVATYVVLTTCDDVDIHRARIEGRERGIPGWHELAWEDVARSRQSWVAPSDVDLDLDCMRPIAQVTAEVDAGLGAFVR